MSKNLDIERKVCSFCGKDQGKVRKMVAGPGGVFICDECVELCSVIMFGEETTSPIFTIESLPKPAEIKEFLDMYVIGQEYAKKSLAVSYITITEGSHFSVIVNRMMWKSRRATSSL